MKIDVLIGSAQPVLEEALGRLRQMPESLKPFVIVEELGDRQRFVQFAGSFEKGLLFDVPALGISYHLPDPDNLSAATTLALSTLTERLGVPPSAAVRITEAVTNSDLNGQSPN